MSGKPHSPLQIRHPLLLAIAAFSLQGCVLAVAAVPLAAGGAIVRSAVDGERTRQAIAEGTDIDPDAIAVSSLGQYAVLPGGVLPAPVAPVPTAGALGSFNTFASNTLAQLNDGERVYSAMLADPGSLQPTRKPCEAEIPAVLIDLDPADGLMPLGTATAPDPSLVSVIENLRRSDVAIAWITDREPTDAGPIRQSLLQSRLDPTGRDPLFVQRYPGELKQARRQALLETHCLIAIAGDDRRDFDDLFTYLRDQTFASALEPMIGEGWFIIPNPLD